MYALKRFANESLIRRTREQIKSSKKIERDLPKQQGMHFSDMQKENIKEISKRLKINFKIALFIFVLRDLFAKTRKQ